MSEFKDALEKIAKENGIPLTEEVYRFGLSDEEYARQLALSREEDREDNAALYNHSFSHFVRPTVKQDPKPTKVSKPKKKRPVVSAADRLFKLYQRQLADKKYELENAFEGGDINQLADELDSIKKSIYKKAKQYPNLYKLLGEGSLEEGDKKIFDKETGYNVSADELFIFDRLKEKYPNIKMSYTDDRFVNPDTHRHFQLDFYDPDSDTGFNYNKHCKHGRRMYNPDDPNCQKDIKWLQSKSEPGNFYEKILHTWRDLDPLKREIAKQNGLNFIEWFNIDEFNKWYENPNLTYEEYKYAPDSIQYDSDEYFAQKARHRDIYGNDSKWDE